MALFSVGLQHRCSCFASHARTIIPVLWNIDKIRSIVERYWQSKVEVMRVQWSPDEENTELTHGIQELHALVCVLHCTRGTSHWCCTTNVGMFHLISITNN